MFHLPELPRFVRSCSADEVPTQPCNEVGAVFGYCYGFVPTSLRRRTVHGSIVGVRARQGPRFPTFVSALIPTYDSA